MAKEIIEEIKSVEQASKRLLDQALIDAANIVDKAKKDAALFYDEKIKEAYDRYDKEIDDATNIATDELKKEDEKIVATKDDLKKTALTKKDEAIKEIISKLV